MLIVAIGWIYVVLMMSITEQSVVAGCLTFLLYGVFPVAVILYVMGAPGRKRKRKNAEKLQRESVEQNKDDKDQSIQ
jgi:biotin transporter BioY